MEVQNKTYLLYLDGLRATAALFVVLHHITLQFQFKDFLALNFCERYSIFIFLRSGHYAVDFFIVLSGFCLTIPMVKANEFKFRDNILSFYKKRMKRIILPYFFALATSLILIHFFIGVKTGTHWDVSIPVTRKDIITHLFLIQDFFNSTFVKINHAFWSISVECRLYLFFPLLLFIWRRFGGFASLLVSVFISIIMLLVTVFLTRNYNSDITIYEDGINPYLILFTCGMLACEVALGNKTNFIWLRNKLPWGLITILLTIFIFVFQRLTAGSKFAYWFEFMDITLGCWGFSLLIVVSNGRLWLQKMFSYKPLVFIGTFAYSIYLIHAPLIQLIWQYLINPLGLSDLKGYYALVLIGTPLILGVSYLFYLAFERPFMNHKKPQLNSNSNINNWVNL